MIAREGDRAAWRFIEFFTANIRNLSPQMTQMAADERGAVLNKDTRQTIFTRMDREGDPRTYAIIGAAIEVHRPLGHTGDFFDHLLLVLFAFGADGLLTRAELWEPDREAEALARFDELSETSEHLAFPSLPRRGLGGGCRRGISKPPLTPPW